jgi:hypothetical protein
VPNSCSSTPPPCVDVEGLEDLHGDISGWGVPGTGSVLVAAHDPGVHPDRPVSALIAVRAAAQLLEHTGRSTVG